MKTENHVPTIRLFYAARKRVVPPQKAIIKDISLSFFPGAKIGLLGLNGAGKIHRAAIMAGVDKEFERRSRADGRR